LLLVFQATQAQPGCTDPQANNFNPSATENDGTCTYTPILLQPSVRSELPSQLEEASGLERWESYLITHNDGGGQAIIYLLDSLTGGIEREVVLRGVNNIDWEDLARDETHLYVGDFGNNSGNRTDLRVLKVELEDSLLDSAEVEVIQFEYADQTGNQGGLNENDYDGEAFLALGDSLHLFTKNWVDNQTRHYAMPKVPGNYSLEVRESFDVQGLVTSADIDSVGTINLLGYTETGQAFIWVLFDYKETRFFSGNKRQFFLEVPALNSQQEGIVFYGNSQVYSLSEALFGLNEAQLFALDLSPYTTNMPLNTVDPFGNIDVQITPNPAVSFIQITSTPSLPQVHCTLFSTNGQIVLRRSFESLQQASFSLPTLASGTYYLQIHSKSVDRVYPISIQQ